MVLGYPFWGMNLRKDSVTGFENRGVLYPFSGLSFQSFRVEEDFEFYTVERLWVSLRPTHTVFS